MVNARVVHGTHVHSPYKFDYQMDEMQENRTGNNNNNNKI